MQHLMLRQDVIEAVEQGKFHLHAIDTIEQALELLMDRPAGQIDAKGKYTKGSIYSEVMRQLKSWQVLESGEPERDKKRKKKKSKSKKAGLQKQPVEDITEESLTPLNEATAVKPSSSQPDEQGS